MVFERVKPHIVLKLDEKEKPEKIINFRKAPTTENERVRAILMDGDGKAVNAIARELKTSREKVYLTINKALSFGIECA